MAAAATEKAAAAAAARRLKNEARDKAAVEARAKSEAAAATVETTKAELAELQRKKAPGRFGSCSDARQRSEEQEESRA
jgi:hypothetical protein